MKINCRLPPRVIQCFGPVYKTIDKPACPDDIIFQTYLKQQGLTSCRISVQQIVLFVITAKQNWKEFGVERVIKY